LWSRKFPRVEVLGKEGNFFNFHSFFAMNSPLPTTQLCGFPSPSDSEPTDFGINMPSPRIIPATPFSLTISTEEEPSTERSETIPWEEAVRIGTPCNLTWEFEEEIEICRAPKKRKQEDQTPNIEKPKLRRSPCSLLFPAFEAPRIILDGGEHALYFCPDCGQRDTYQKCEGRVYKCLRCTTSFTVVN
jgi:hypothetical protein